MLTCLFTCQVDHKLIADLTYMYVCMFYVNTSDKGDKKMMKEIRNCKYLVFHMQPFHTFRELFFFPPEE